MTLCIAKVIHTLSNTLVHICADSTKAQLQITFIMSATSTTTPTSSTTMKSETEAPGPCRFSMSGLTALHLSTFALGFSNNERQAAARALLRHDVHIDGTHYQTRTHGGLHPSYLGFQPAPQLESERTLSHKELSEAALQDVFDAVSEFVFCSSISHCFRSLCRTVLMVVFHCLFDAQDLMQSHQRKSLSTSTSHPESCMKHPSRLEETSQC